MGVSWTRRTFLSSLSSAATTFGDGTVFPSERVRFADSATENEVWRLTNPGYTSLLPPPQARSSSSRGGFLVFSSDRTGSMQAFRMDLRSGESRQLSSAEKLNPSTLALAADEKSIVYFDNDRLSTLNLGNLRARELGQGEPDRGAAVSDDGQFFTWFAGDDLIVNGSRAGEKRIRCGPDARIPVTRPKRAAVLFQKSGELWLASFDASENRRLKTAPNAAEPQWSPDGRSILYLSGSDLREHVPDTNTDSLLAKTSQFSSFGRNGDASVFVGASRSKAGPYILLLLRVTRREMAICEHRCSNPSAVHPSFAPSSQRIYFQSDRNGKMAIYTMAVERLVEKTDT